MRRGHKVGELTRGRGHVFEADQILYDPAQHKIVPGELYTHQKVNLVGENGVEIRGTWPRCRRVCKTFLDAEVRYDGGPRR